MSQVIGFNDLFNLGDFEQGTKKLAEVISAITKEIDQAKKNATQLSAALGASLKAEITALNASSDKLETNLEQMNKKMADFKNTTAQTSSVIDKYEKETEKLRQELEKLKTAQEKETKATKDATQAKTANAKVSAAMHQSLLGVATGAAILHRGIQILTDQFKKALQSTLEFETAMKEVQAITRSSSQELELLTANANKLGATTEKTAGQIANLQKELGKLGFNTTEILASTQSIVDLSTATGEDLVKSGEVAAATLRAFGLDATEMTRVVDVMTGSFVRSGLDLEKFRESMKLVAPIAAATGVEIEVTTAALSKLADTGISGSLAGTALRNLLSSMADPSEKLTKFLGQLNSELADGVKSSEDFALALKELKKSNIDLEQAVQMVDVRARSAFFTLVQQAEAIEGLTYEYQALNGETRDIAGVMRDTLANDILIAESAFDALRRNIVEKFNPALRESVQETTTLIEAMRLMVNDIDKFVDSGILEKFFFGDDDPDNFFNTVFEPLITYMTTVRGFFTDYVKYGKAVEEFDNLNTSLTKTNEELKDLSTNVSFLETVESTIKNIGKEGVSFDNIKKIVSAMGSEYEDINIQLEKGLDTEKATYRVKERLIQGIKTQVAIYDQNALQFGEIGKRIEQISETEEDRLKNIDEYNQLTAKQGKLSAWLYQNANNYNRAKEVLSQIQVKGLKVNVEDEESEKAKLKSLQERIKIENELSEVQLKREIDILNLQTKLETDPVKKLAVQEKLYTKQVELAKLKYENELRLLEAISKDDENYLLLRELAYQRYIDNLNKIGDKFINEQVDFQTQAVNKLAQATEKATKEGYEALDKLAKKHSEDKKEQDEEDINKEREKWETILNIVEEAGRGLSQFTTLIFDNRALARQNDLAEIDAWLEYQLKSAGDNEEAKARLEEEAERRRAKIKKKQAQDDKKEAIFQIGIRTAMGVMSALAMFPPNPVLAAIIGAAGVLQMATVLARPLPEFAKGTDNSPEGFAIVGEEGRELIKDGRTGRVRLSEDRPSIEYLRKGSVVIPADQTKAILANPNFDHNGTAERFLGSSRPQQSYSGVDYDRLEQSVSKAVSNIPINLTNFDDKGVANYVMRRQSKIRRINKRY